MTTDRICPGCLKPLTSNTRQRLVCLTPDCRFTPFRPVVEILQRHGASEIAVISDGPPSDTPLEQEER